MLDSNALFVKYSNDFMNFTGKHPDKHSPESMSVFMQYINARHTLHLSGQIKELNQSLKDLKDTLRNK